MNRNYATGLLNNGHKRKRAGSGRESKFADPEFRPALRRMWSAAHHLCGKLLKAAMPRYVDFYHSEYGPLREEDREKLPAISAASIDRALRPVEARHGKTMTRPGSLLVEEIPVRTDYWSNLSHGFLEGNSAAHCGGSIKGPFIWTITFIDIATTWVETRAVWTAERRKHRRGNTGCPEKPSFRAHCS